MDFRLLKSRYKNLKRSLLWLILLLPTSSSALAQTVTSDNTTGTAIAGSAPFAITEGTLRPSNTGTTLFHSFEQFSPATSQVIFDLQNSQNTIDTQAITAIIGRVTGGSESFINGELTILQDVNTPAPDLFLINPQGILFGESAKLSLPGSFLASTADSISFANGTPFSAKNPEAVPLLTVSAPVGLQFGSSNGITLNGNGHAIATSNPIFAPYFPTSASSGLSVSPGKSLSLIGGSLNIKGGVLSAPSGRVNVGSVQTGTVSLEEQTLGYRAVEEFGDISLIERSLIDVSGAIAGSIQLQGRRLLLAGGSIVWSQNRGLSPAGEISANATEQIDIVGTTPFVDAASGIISETVAPGNASNINITAPKLTVQAGALLGNRSFSPGDTGHLNIVTEKTVISGYSPVAPDVFSSIGTATFREGSGGNVTLAARDLSVADGGYLGSTTLGSGQGGNVAVTTIAVEVIGATPTAIASNIGATTAGGSGNSGNVELRTGTLNLQDSGLVSTTSIGTGNAGNILVNASKRIDISGRLPNLPSSTIASTVDFPPLGLQLLLGLTGIPRGSSGDVAISTPILNIRESGTVTVANLAEGNAGQLAINANSVSVNQSAIDALTQAGEGGNITLNIRDSLLLRGANVNATARGDGNGGNLTIHSPVIVGLENSDIIASATTGNGGNINITTQGIFGLTPREQRTPQSDITASSEFGLSGTVSVSGLAIRPEAGLVELSDQLSDPDTQVSKGCSPTQGNRFIASGKGGLPTAPTGMLTLINPWTDLRAIALTRHDTTNDSAQLTEATPEPTTLLEASNWQTDNAGRVTLTAIESNPIHTDSSNCLAAGANP